MDNNVTDNSVDNNVNDNPVDDNSTSASEDPDTKWAVELGKNILMLLIYRDKELTTTT